MAQTHAPPQLSDEDWLLPFLDVLLILVLILLPLINPPTKDGDIASPGSLIVEIRWPDDCDSDLDLWVKAPQDRAVGYSSPKGRVFNLLRDDLGNRSDLSGLNYENAYTRGLPAGEYAVTVHLYRNNGCDLPVPVDIRVSRKRETGVATLHQTRVLLSKVGEEVTGARFKLDKRAHLIGDVHDLPIKLRAKR